MRIFRRCGSAREVHGVITDLSRIVAVKLTGVDSNALPKVIKTEVQKVLTQFAFALPHMLGVEAKRIEFPGDILGGTTDRPRIGPSVHFDCGKVLGHGLHGKVHTVVGPGLESFYIKHFPDEQECQKEATVLEQLANESIPHVPTLIKVSEDGHSILASPVGTDSYHWQGHGIVWRIGRQLLDTLEQLHATGRCHRDVRPNNIVIQKDETALLIDWVSEAAEENIAGEYTGTTHYASEEGLTALVDGEVPTPAARHYLESLVYSIYSLSREPTNYIRATQIEKGPMHAHSEDFYDAVRSAWQQEVQTNDMLRILVEAARRCDYGTLKTEFGRKF